MMDRHRLHKDYGDKYKRNYDKRTRVDGIEEHLARLILNINTNTKDLSIESNIEELALTLEVHLKNYKNKITNIISECAVKFPTKCTLYSTLVGMLNAKSYEYGGEFVNHMEVMFNNTLKTSKWEKARFILQFLANLVNCNVVSATAFFKLLNKMVNEVSNDSVPQVRQDWFVYCVLTTLPWVGRTLHKKLETELDLLLGIIESFLTARTKHHHPVLQIWTTNAPSEQEEYLDCLWSQVCNLRGKKWHEKFIVRPYLAFHSVLCKSMQHNLPSIILSKHDDRCKYPMPSVVFRIFDNADCPENQTMPDAHSIERFLIEDELHSILNWYKLDRKNCAAALENLPINKKFPLEYCIIEVILGELFHLPTSRCSQIACSSILVELCKSKSLNIQLTLEQTVKLLFMRIETMKVVCVDRFINWFSYHLSNFHYRWDWENWKDCIVLDEEHPKMRFIKEVIVKCMRLSYHERVSQMLPKTFARLIPVKPESDYKYSKDNTVSLPGTRAAHKLLVSITRNSTADEILEILNAIPNPKFHQIKSNYNPLQIDVFVQTVLHLGSKSCTHSIKKIAKFYKVFKVLSKSEKAQIRILKNLFEVLHCNQQMMILLVKKLIKIKVVECSSVIHWIFSIEMRPELSKLYMWEILNCSIIIMNKYISKLSRELKEAIDESYSEEQIEEIQDKLKVAEDDHENLFLITFKRLTMILCDHLAECDRNENDYNTYWYKMILGRLEQVLFEHHVQIQKLTLNIITLVFTKNLDSRILNTYHQFVSFTSI